MRRHPPLLPLAILGACLLGLLFFWRWHGADGGLAGEARSDPSLEGRGAVQVLEASDPSAPPLPEGAAPAPRAAAEGAAAAGADSTEPVPDARIDGLVLRPDGKPAALARVQFTQWRSDRGPEDQPEDSTLTDEQGLFTINPAPVGALRLVALHDEFSASLPSEFALAAGEHKRNLRLELREYARIQGLVLDAHNVARAKIVVTCEDLDSRKALFCESDAAGRFEFSKVVPGTKIVSVKLPAQELEEIRADAPFLANQLSRSDQEQLVEVAAGQTRELVLGGIPSGGVRVFGQVRSGGTPLAHNWVWIENFRVAWFVIPRARTDERGEYELWVPAKGQYDFHIVGAGGGLHLARQESITAEHEQRVDFEVPGGSIRGRVVDAAGRPVPEVVLDLSLQGQDFEVQPGVYIPFMPFCTADAEGRFAFVNLPAGHYDLRANPVSKPDAQSAFARAVLRDLELAAGATIAGLEVVLTPGCTIRGVVHGAPEGSARALRVTAFDESGRACESGAVDSDATFVLRGLTEGRYGLYVHGLNLASAVSEPVQVRGGHEAEVEINLGPGLTPLLSAKWEGEGRPRKLGFALRDARKNLIWETEFEDPPEDEPTLLVAPGAYEFELSGPDGWHGRETVVLAADKPARVEVLLRHAK